MKHWPSPGPWPAAFVFAALAKSGGAGWLTSEARCNHRTGQARSAVVRFRPNRRVPESFQSGDDALKMMKGLKWGYSTKAKEAKASFESVFKVFLGKSDPRLPNFDLQIWFEALDKPIDQTPLVQSELKNGFTLEPATWQGFSIDGVRESSKELTDAGQIQHVVLIPLAKRALRIRFAGPLAKDALLIKTRDQLLSGLEGKTNWRPMEQGIKRGDKVNDGTIPQSHSFQEKVEAVGRVFLYGGLAILFGWFAFRNLRN